MTAYISRRLASRLLDDFGEQGGNSGLRQLLGAPATKPLSPAEEGTSPPPGSPSEPQSQPQPQPQSEPAQQNQVNPFDMLMQGLFNEVEKGKSTEQ